MRWMLASAAAMLLGSAAAAQSPDVKAGVDAWGRGDWRAAVEKWRPQAIAGDPDAQFNLGQAYKLGRGVPEDPAMAEGWFRRAAIQGHPQAEVNYALALFGGGNKVGALPWLERAAGRGEPRAQHVLGTMLFNGDGVKADRVRAYALMSRASAAGLSPASQTLAQMDGFVTPAERQRGLELARRYEAEARLTDVAAPTPAQAQLAPAPTTPTPRPTVAPKLTAAPATKPAAAASPKPAQLKSVPPRPTAAKPAAPVTLATDGGYRVQLGAFRDAGNAKALWTRIAPRVGGSPSYASAGGFTRLQAGPFRTRADAQRACAKSGVSCVVVAP